MSSINDVRSEDMFRIVGNGALYISSPTLGEDVPEIILNSELNEDYTILSAYACHSFLGRIPLIYNMISGGNIPKLNINDIKGKKIIIVKDQMGLSNTLYDPEVTRYLNNEGLESEIALIDKICISPFGGEVVGFVNNARGKYNKMLSNQFVGQHFLDQKFSDQVPLEDFLKYL